jgi:hypothetical protein
MGVMLCVCTAYRIGVRLLLMAKSMEKAQKTALFEWQKGKAYNFYHFL